MLVLISCDVFFASKVTGTAAALGLTAKTVSTLEQLATADAIAVILDLGCGLAPAAVLDVVTDSARERSLAFGPHVDTAALEAATQAGFRIVVPRSRFSAELPEWLRKLSEPG